MGIYETHLADNGSVLPHVIFWDITQAIDASFLLDIPEVNRVIVTLFLESLPFAGEPGHGIVDQLGPALQTRYHLIRPHD